MKPIREYDHIVWDWNGTLLNDAQFCLELINVQVVHHAGEPITFEHFTREMTFPISLFYQKVGLPFEGEAFAKVSDLFHVDYHERVCECALHEGALALLRYNAECGKTQSVLSAHPLPLLQQSVKRFEVDSFFTALAAPDDNLSKSKIEVGRRWLAQSGLDATKIVMFGDTVHDYEVASALGFDVALIAAGSQHRSLLEACGVPVVDSLTEILDRQVHSA